MIFTTKYEPVHFTVNVHQAIKGDATDVLAVDAVFGEKIEEPVVSKPGYNLDGWYKEPEYVHRWDFENDVVDGPVNLYAKWSILHLPGSAPGAEDDNEAALKEETVLTGDILETQEETVAFLIEETSESIDENDPSYVNGKGRGRSSKTNDASNALFWIVFVSICVGGGYTTYQIKKRG